MNLTPRIHMQHTKTVSALEKSQFSPKYWGTWVLIGMAYLVAYLPLRARSILGRLLGELLRSRKKLSHVAWVNISRCFPNLDAKQQQVLMQNYFTNQGLDIVETLVIWCRNSFHLVDNHVAVEGLEFLQEALKQNKGIILLSSHFGNVDMSAMLMAHIGKKYKLFDFSATYREQSNPVLDGFMKRGRKQYFKNLIPVNNMRRVSQQLKNKKIVWYAPDMNVDKKNATFVSFLGVKAATTTAISRLAKLTDSIVVPYAHYRAPGNQDYRVKIFPPLENFPSADVALDTAKVSEFVERLVMEQPDRYWWILRRFKTRPPGETSFY